MQHAVASKRRRTCYNHDFCVISFIVQLRASIISMWIISISLIRASLLTHWFCWVLCSCGVPPPLRRCSPPGGRDHGTLFLPCIFELSVVLEYFRDRSAHRILAIPGPEPLENRSIRPDEKHRPVPLDGFRPEESTFGGLEFLEERVRFASIHFAFLENVVFDAPRRLHFRQAFVVQRLLHPELATWEAQYSQSWTSMGQDERSRQCLVCCSNVVGPSWLSAALWRGRRDVDRGLRRASR
mmetsp:Transcript_14002/g.34640  ORF Transcript_14002/g.34640 Transcript_14002/m.34640 type:complete len:240 (-) Transcript_14002:521-1240(-)